MDKSKNNTSNEYLKTKVMTASPEELQLMLYDGLLRFCEQARTAIEEKRIEESYQLLLKAQKIVMELVCSMKVEIAPDICENLRLLYMFCYERLVEANLTKDIKMVDEALDVIHHIRETWKMLIDKLREERHGQAEELAAGAALGGGEMAPAAGHGEFAASIGSTVSFEG